MAACIVLASVLALWIPAAASAQSANDIGALGKEVARLHGQGKYVEAIPLAEQLLATKQRVLGKDHPASLRSVANLAELYRTQGRYAEAEALYYRTAVAQEWMLGNQHPDTLTSVNGMGVLCYVQGRYAEAKRLFPLIAAFGFVRQILGLGSLLLRPPC